MIKLYNGDCSEVLKSIPDGSVDLILQDPPYNTTACKWEWDIMTKIDEFWSEWNRIIKHNGAIVMFGSEPFSSKLRLSNLKNYKYDWIWNKKQASNQLNAKRQPLKIHELVHIFSSSGTANYYPLMTKGKFRKKGGSKVKSEIVGDSIIGYHTFNDDYYPVSILDNFSNANRNNRVHPTQKPVALMEYLIKTYTNEDETVFDGFMGSGSTGVAAKNLGRNFIGVELDEKYFNIAKERIGD